MGDPVRDAVLLFDAAEALGYAPADKAVPVLLRMLEHDSPIAREGAVHGLDNHSEELGVADRLRKVAAEDKSAAVRHVASNATCLLASPPAPKEAEPCGECGGDGIVPGDDDGEGDCKPCPRGCRPGGGGQHRCTVGGCDNQAAPLRAICGQHAQDHDADEKERRIHD